MRVLHIEVTLEPPDGSPWPLASVYEAQPETDSTYVICDGLRLPYRSAVNVSRWIHDVYFTWATYGQLEAQSVATAGAVGRPWPRRPGAH